MVSNVSWILLLFRTRFSPRREIDSSFFEAASAVVNSLSTDWDRKDFLPMIISVLSSRLTLTLAGQEHSPTPNSSRRFATKTPAPSLQEPLLKMQCVYLWLSSFSLDSRFTWRVKAPFIFNADIKHPSNKLSTQRPHQSMHLASALFFLSFFFSIYLIALQKSIQSIHKSLFLIYF